MKGRTFWELGLPLILFGLIMPIFLGIIEIYSNIGLGIFGLSIGIISPIMGFLFLLYGKWKIKIEFIQKLKELIERKKEFSPSDLQRIEEEIFGNTTIFGPARIPVGGGAHDFSLSQNYRQLWIIQKIEEIMKLKG